VTEIERLAAIARELDIWHPAVREARMSDEEERRLLLALRERARALGLTALIPLIDEMLANIEPNPKP
jgi:hypothetical protein